MARYPKTPQKTIDKIIKHCIEAKMNQTQIAAKFGVSVAVVYRAWTAYRLANERPRGAMAARYPDHE